MTSLAELAETALDRLGDHVSVVFEGEQHRMSELQERSARLARGLRDIGVRPGERVVLQMTNRPEVLVVLAAAWRAGAVATPVMPTLTPLELRHVLTDSGAVALVVSEDLLTRAREAAVGLVVQVVVAGEGGATRLADLEQAAPLPLQQRAGADVAALLYTGGTTGRSKGVALTHDNLLFTTRGRAGVLAAARAPRLLVPLPLSHVFGLTNTVTRWQLDDPAPMVLQRRFAAQEWLGLVQEHGVQCSALVPSMLALLLREDLDAYDLSSLRYVTTGGAPLARTLWERFEQRLPHVRVGDGYGCTEVCSTATMSPYDARRHGTVGRPLPGVELAVLDDDLQPVPVGTDGEVCVRSPGVMAGYWGDPAATAEAVVDGWLHTGDLGHLDEDGYLTVVDRKKDLVIRGGFNVYPRDVEDALLEHAEVAAAAVIGRPDEVLGEEVVAFVALRAGAAATREDLLAWAAERLAAHKRPRELHVVDAVPLTSVGKTDRKALRALA